MVVFKFSQDPPVFNFNRPVKKTTPADIVFHWRFLALYVPGIFTQSVLVLI